MKGQTTIMSTPDIQLIATELAETLPKMRFFADKAAKIDRVEVLSLESGVNATEENPAVDVAVVKVHTDAGAPTYLLPIAWSTEIPEGHDQSLLVKAEGILGYDAMIDPTAITALGKEVATAGRLGTMELKKVPGAEFVTPEAGRAMGVEQSNTSVIFDEKVMCKIFRRLHPGTNADVELLSALSRAECDAVPHLYGWLELELGEDTYTTGMLQRFVPNSTDGWAMALNSVRAAIRQIDMELAEMGTDFASESFALGKAVAEVHHSLAAALPASRRLSGAEIVAPMRTRLDFVAGVVPEVAALADKARAVFDAAEESVPDKGAVVQRIHGDLHLGQILRTPRSWLLIDFEGEPSRPWNERRLPDHPLRDIAGMLRSFDYAAHFPLLSSREDTSETAPRVREWADRNIEQFLAGYGDAADSALLEAFVLDKAIYECLYEAQNRPEWLKLPLNAVEKLLR